MALDYDELRRQLEQRQKGEQKPGAVARPGARRPAPTGTTRRPTTEEQSEVATQRRRAPLPPRPPVELIAAVATGVLLLPGIALFLVARGFEPVLSFPYRLGGSVGVVIGAIYTLVVLQWFKRYGEPRS